MSNACVFDNAKQLVSDLVDRILDGAEQWRIVSAKELRILTLHTSSPDCAAPLAAAAQLGVVLAISVQFSLVGFAFSLALPRFVKLRFYSPHLLI
jgi:hypothetical protein